MTMERQGSQNRFDLSQEGNFMNGLVFPGCFILIRVFTVSLPSILPSHSAPYPLPFELNLLKNDTPPNRLNLSHQGTCSFPGEVGSPYPTQGPFSQHSLRAYS